MDNLYYWTVMLSKIFWEVTSMGKGGEGFSCSWYFRILRNSHQDLSIEGSDFILSSLEVGHWVAQT